MPKFNFNTWYEINCDICQKEWECPHADTLCSAHIKKTQVPKETQEAIGNSCKCKLFEPK